MRRRHLAELEATDYAAEIARARAVLVESIKDPTAELDPVRAAYRLATLLRRAQRAEHDIADLRGSLGIPHAEPSDRRTPRVLDLLAEAADTAARDTVSAEVAARTAEIDAAQRPEDLPEPRRLDPSQHDYLSDSVGRTARTVAELTEQLRATEARPARTEAEQGSRDRTIRGLRTELDTARRQAATAADRLAAFRAGQPIAWGATDPAAFRTG